MWHGQYQLHSETWGEVGRRGIIPISEQFSIHKLPMKVINVNQVLIKLIFFLFFRWSIYMLAHNVGIVVQP